jgi:predicted DNA-binding transcriptional regulator YafY
MKNKRIIRLLRLLQMLQSGPGKNASALAKAFDVTRRTVFRDLQVLRDADLPLDYDAKTERYYVSPRWAMPPSKLTEEEAFALIGLATEFGRNKELPFYDAAHNAAVKLERMLPASLRRGLRRKTQAIRIRPGKLTEKLGSKASVYQQLVTAISQRRAVKITYGSLTEWATIETKLRPYQLLFTRHSWYVLGLSSVHREVRTFNVIRIKSTELLDEKYSIPRSFDLDRHFGNAWYMIPGHGRDSHVIVRFKHLVAQNVAEVQWHKSQRAHFLADGSLEYHVTVCGLEEISWWILGYGDQAEVIQPARLRRLVCQRAKNMVATYGEDC